MSQLSDRLRDLGFYPVLGTVENLHSEERTVGSGEPCTSNYNNGARVVYDEQGNPWLADEGVIYEIPQFEAAMLELDATFNLRHDGWVPHSNGTSFVTRTVAPHNRSHWQRLLTEHAAHDDGTIPLPPATTSRL